MSTPTYKNCHRATPPGVQYILRFPPYHTE